MPTTCKIFFIRIKLKINLLFLIYLSNITYSRCYTCSSCAAGTYQIIPCTSTSDRECGLCPSCPMDGYNQGCGGNSPGKCVPCVACNSAGYYLSGCTGTSAGTCTMCGTCIAGYYRVGCTWTSAGECRGCEAGGYCAGGSAGRVVCPKGSYCPSTSSQPTNCLKGTYSASESATAQSTCLSCNAGYFSGADGATVCTICNTGSMSLAGAGFCTSCIAGMYSESSGAIACVLCPAGKYSIVSGATSCVYCSAGKYNELISMTFCLSCSDGTFATVIGSTECKQCVPGKYFISVFDQCSDCAKGTYSQYYKASSCTPCEKGTYSTSMGSKLPSDCQQCLQICILPGQYGSCGLDTSGNCSSCRNTPSPNTAYYVVSDSTGFNSTCPTSITSPGYYRNCTNPSAPMWIGDPPIQYGSDCNYRDSVNNQPYYYCSSYGMYMWWQNTKWVGSTVFANVGTDTFTESGPGLDPYADTFYRQPMIILHTNLAQPYVNWVNPCPKGTYSPSQGATACIPASPGNYVSSSYATSQTLCQTGLYSLTGASSCTQTCPAGTYNTTMSQCSLVTPGFYSKTGASIPCPGGTFSSMSGASVCDGCAVGTFNSILGMSSISACTPCASGSFSASIRSSSCKLCTPGLYTSVSGSTVCTKCPIGKHTQINGTATDCTWCTNGISYSTTTGSTTCTVCSKTCPIGLQIQNQCTPTSDVICSFCTPVVNCVFIPGTVCGNNTHPNCLCPPGLEISDGQCQQCRPGFFKSTNSTLPCTPWTNNLVCPAGHFVSNGTRFTDMACLECPKPPGNGTVWSPGCQWGCAAGFNRTVFR